MSSSRVVITGAGAVTALGVGKGALFDGLREGRSAFSFRSFRHERLPELPPLYGAFIDEFQVSDFLGRKGIRSLSRESRIFMCAAVMACAEAGLTPRVWERPSVGVFGASVLSGYEDYLRLFTDGLLDGVDRINPAQGPQTGFNAPTSQLAIHLGAEGPNITLTTGGTSSLDAVAYAADYLRDGRAKVIFAGGVETLSYFSAREFISGGAAGAVQPPRPFDPGRNGTVFGEAGAAFVLENAAEAHAHGGRIQAEVLGYGRAFEPPSSPCALERASRRAISEALRETGLEPHAIEAVYASAGGEREADAAEAASLFEVFGGRVPVYCVKGAVGECLGAAGALQIAAALLGLTQNVIPRTLGFHTPDQASPALRVTTEPLRLTPRHVLIHALDVGGSATALILAAPEPL